MFTIQEILNATNGRLITGDIRTRVNGISIDSRTVKPGELFIAIQGNRFDGHDFIKEAIDKKAAGAVISKSIIHYPLSIIHYPVFIEVSDTIKALGQIACYYRKKVKIPVIAVTGSNGKTTTKEMVASILQKRYNILKSSGTQNNHIGVPLALLGLNSQHEACVLEMGTNHIGEIRSLSYIAQPNIGIITNIGPSHLEFLGDIEGVFKAKVELLENFDSDSTVILNGDDERLVRIKEQKNKYKIITFGFNPRCEFLASNLSCEDGRLKFILNGKKSIELKTPAKTNVYNGLAAIATSSILGVNYQDIKDALSNFVFPTMRMEIKELRGLRVIDDSYNSNPQSLSVAVETLSEQDSSGKRVLVAGDMLELGKAAKDLHYDIGKLVANSKINLLITVGELSKNICQGALDGGMEEGAVLSCDSNQEAVDYLLRFARAGDTILIKGSRAMKMEEITKCFITSFTH